jgi:hypothetical protein
VATEGIGATSLSAAKRRKRGKGKKATMEDIMKPGDEGRETGLAIHRYHIRNGWPRRWVLGRIHGMAVIRVKECRPAAFFHSHNAKYDRARKHNCRQEG